MSSIALLREKLVAAEKEGQLLPSAAANILKVYESPAVTPLDVASVDELVEGGAWSELNDRFFKSLAFGTGGIRGRTIGKKITKAEQGTPSPLGAPEFPAVGTNMMNTANLGRAALGLGLHLQKAFPGQRNKVVIARHYKAQAGIVISASHNPPHDNGFKAYFADGAQLVEPDASGVIAEVNALASGETVPQAAAAPGTLTPLGAEADAVYIEALKTLLLEPTAFVAKPKIVYSSLHGTGIRIIPALFDQVGVSYSIVEAQRQGDGRFPTVKSPNPEESAALALSIEQAKAEGADLVIATDPDCDRMGAVVRDAQGEYVIITGNMIGSILAGYRVERFFAQGIVNEKNKAHTALIKTFVTTDLQKEIARVYGIKCIDTLTGFKYIGEKLRDYEKQTGLADYDAQSHAARRAAQLEKGTFFIFGGEESYGYSGGDYVRDKDGNAAALMLAEAAAWSKAQGQTLLDYLDALYRRFGFYTEKLGTLTFEGAKGAAQIQTLLASYRTTPPLTFLGHGVAAIEDFGKQNFKDVDGKAIPKETMLLFHLVDGGRMVVRGSGTEPKIKFYFFGRANVPEGSNLEEIKQERRAILDAWWDEVQADVKQRVGDA